MQVLLIHLLLLLCSLLPVLCTLLCSKFPASAEILCTAVVYCTTPHAAMGYNMGGWKVCHACSLPCGDAPIAIHNGAGSLNGRQVSIPASCFGVGRFFHGSVYTAHCGIRYHHKVSRRKDPEGRFYTQNSLQHCVSSMAGLKASCKLCSPLHRQPCQALSHLTPRRLQIAQGASAWPKCCRDWQ